MPKVLIADALSPRAVAIFAARGIEVEQKTGLPPDELKAIIGDYDGLAIRSATKVTAELLTVATRLKVVGRAGIGVDNVDVPAATGHGVIVMNTPFGNSITTAEHAIALIFALARQLPAANASTHAGKWEKARFMGVELTGKTLGIVGCGNVGGNVALRALGLQMKVLACDPFLTPERALALGVERAELPQLLARADFITLHTPLTDATRNVIDAAALKQCKRGVYIVNCARGGLIDEAALKTALDGGQVAGAALDVFATEPAKEHPLFGHAAVICTPHLGAATTEAQENVALQVAEQMSDYLLTGAIANALNMPALSAEDAPKLRPYLQLAALLGGFAGQVTADGIHAVTLTCGGQAAQVNTQPLTNTVLMALLQPSLASVNLVNAPGVAKERGITLTTARQDGAGDYQSWLRLTVTTATATLTLAGTLFGGKPRLIRIDDVGLEAELTPQMLLIRNEDKPGLIGRIGGALGDAGLNIANFNLGRSRPGAPAICLVAIDAPAKPVALAQLAALPGVVSVQPLTF